ncbi:hypothetical protein J437_LFUL008737 [Ladona fulva]|uniref:Uncharacterized protein n=1 Tax=Ladona fulva TaxID=123851 RepID=A0A8K0K635_LADFU|nr:hypothetical protein J437_LFUL008737 [Ladona fulva]
MKYKEFFERYKVLVKTSYVSKGAPRSKDAFLQPYGDSKISMDCESKWQTGCRDILSRVLEMQNIDVLWGKNSLIFKEPLLIKLETKKKEIYKKAASIIQKFWNNYRFSIKRNVMDITYFSNETYCKAKKYNAVSIHPSSQSTHKRNDFRVLYFGDGIISKQEIPKVQVRFYTKYTCIPYSHCFPRILRPKGLCDAF